MENLANNDWVSVSYTVDFPNIDKYGIETHENKQVSTGISINNFDNRQKFTLAAVPITEEILLKNLFEKYVDGQLITYFFQKDNPDGTENFDITIYKDADEDLFKVRAVNNDPFITVIKNIIAVHELQEILRVCNLHEMSYNFKI